MSPLRQHFSEQNSSTCHCCCCSVKMLFKKSWKCPSSESGLQPAAGDGSLPMASIFLGDVSGRGCKKTSGVFKHENIFEKSVFHAHSMEKAEKHRGNLFAGQLAANGSYARVWICFCPPAKPFLGTHPLDTVSSLNIAKSAYLQ